MAGPLTALAVAAILAGDGQAMPVNEKSIFHIPSEDDFRLQRIARTDREQDWPFTVDEGYLTCAYVMGRRAVYFTEMPEDDFDDQDPRTAIVSSDPLDLTFGNLGSGGLVRKVNAVSDLILLMAPFEALGAWLCDQPRGTEIGSGEL